MLILWVLCWAHCTLSRYGAVTGANACTCCEASHSDHAEESHDTAPCHDDAAICGICDFLSNGAPLTQTISPIQPLTAALLLQSWTPAPLPAVVTVSFPLAVAHDPPPLRPLCELLSRTACPVRGPTLHAI